VVAIYSVNKVEIMMVRCMGTVPPSIPVDGIDPAREIVLPFLLPAIDGAVCPRRQTPAPYDLPRAIKSSWASSSLHSSSTRYQKSGCDGPKTPSRRRQSPVFLHCASDTRTCRILQYFHIFWGTNLEELKGPEGLSFVVCGSSQPMRLDLHLVTGNPVSVSIFDQLEYTEPHRGQLARIRLDSGNE